MLHQQAQALDHVHAHQFGERTADPAYRGQTASLLRGMRFQYTGWLRAQKLIPAANLKAGTNDLVIIGGAGTPASAIRATQIQLKYLWDKTDYQLQTDR